MSATPNKPDATADAAPPAAQAYQVIGLVAVAVLAAAQYQAGADRWALLPALVGAAGLAFRWRIAPLAYLATVTFATLAPLWFRLSFGSPIRMSRVTELVLCLGVLVYLLAQYRLMGLTTTVLPVDPLRPKEKPPPRPAGTAREVINALLAAVGATLAAVCLWELASEAVHPRWSIPVRHWRLGLVIWALATVLLGLFSVVGYLGWRRQSREEAALILQDTLWAELRREQRRSARWTAWVRRKS